MKVTARMMHYLKPHTDALLASKDVDLVVTDYMTMSGLTTSLTIVQCEYRPEGLRPSLAERFGRAIKT